MYNILYIAIGTYTYSSGTHTSVKTTKCHCHGDVIECTQVLSLETGYGGVNDVTCRRRDVHSHNNGM